MTTTVLVAGKPTVLMGESYFGFNKEALAVHRNTFTYEGESKEEIVAKIEQNLEKLIYPLRPTVSTQTYFIERNGVLESVRVTIKTVGSFRLKGENFLMQLHAAVDKNLYANLTDSFIDWFERFNAVYCSTINAEVLTAKINEIAAKEKIALPFDLEFAYGDGIVEIDNSKLVLGVSPYALSQLEYNPLFYFKASESSDNAYLNERALVVSYLTAIKENGVSAAVVSSPFTKKYGISTKDFGVQVSNIVSYKLPVVATKLRKGVNIYKGKTAEGFEYIALLDVQPISKEEATAYGDSIILKPNPRPTKAETALGQDQYALYFILNPIARNTQTAFNPEAVESISKVTLADIVATVN